jgi:hypothetical protein
MSKIKKYAYLVVGVENEGSTIPHECETKKQSSLNNDFFNKKVTIYNDIPADSVNDRRFDRFVIEKCNVQKGMLQNADGTIEKVVNAITITTKDTEHYKPSLEYRYLPIDEIEKYYTVQVNDVVIFGEVDDVATTRRELDNLLTEKYKNNGFLVTAVNEYIHGMSVDNVQIIHA